MTAPAPEITFRSGTTPAPAVEDRGLVKRYGEVEALRGIDLTCRAVKCSRCSAARE